MSKWKNLSAEERELFQQAMTDVRRREQDNRITPYKKRPSSRPKQRLHDNARVIEDMMSDPIEPAELETGEELVYMHNSLQQRMMRKLRRGEFSIEANLDLHGLTKIEAREDIAAFVADSKAAGIRCVRIIHGKGHGSHQKRPVLKQYVNHWLRQRNDILAFCSARPVDGGTGAIYVILRKE